MKPTLLPPSPREILYFLPLGGGGARWGVESALPPIPTFPLEGEGRCPPLNPRRGRKSAHVGSSSEYLTDVLGHFQETSLGKRVPGERGRLAVSPQLDAGRCRPEAIAPKPPRRVIYSTPGAQRREVHLSSRSAAKGSPFDSQDSPLPSSTWALPQSSPGSAPGVLCYIIVLAR